jgi:hypothetical protein
MHWHYHLGHLAFKKLQQLAHHGEIPKRLVNVRAPRCAGCLFGAMTKVPWRGKERKSKLTAFIATKPGECVSVDHLISTELGFFGQAKGTLTKTRYKSATFFVNHYSRLIFAYLMASNLNLSETVEAKQAFEQFAAQHGIRVQHYHCDNDQFSNNNFKMACKQSNQRLTFCGVNAQFQNEIAGRAIRDLSESARKQLLHTRQHWPQAVSIAPWPYALCYATHLHNILPVLKDGRSRLEMFSSIQVGSSMKTLHTFGDPVFALHHALMGGK